MNNLTKLTLILLLNLIAVVPLHAKLIKQKGLGFTVDTRVLLKGDIQYSMKLMSPKRLKEKYPQFKELDSLRFLSKKEIKVMVGKSAFVVNKPAGFFDHQHMINEKYVAHVLGEQKVAKMEENSFKITVSNDLEYVLKTYFDSDDISTLPNSKVIQAVAAGRKLDVISQSATSIIFKEMTDFSKYSRGSTSFSSFIPLRENKTLVIVYTISGIDIESAKKSSFKKNFVNEMGAQKSLIESFQ